MKQGPINKPMQVVDDEWVTFPGGELQGRRQAPRPAVRCPACRARSRASTIRPAAPGTLCFECYRESLEHERRLKAAGALDTGSEVRFQGVLPLEPIDRPRLERLRAERTASKAMARVGVGEYTDRRLQAQIAARRALQAAEAGPSESAARGMQAAADWARRMAAVHAAELQLPEAWLPFVVSR